MEINPKIKEILLSGSFEDYEKDCLDCLEEWQYLQSADLSNEDRFTEDVEAYKKRYFNTVHLHNETYNQITLIKMLRKNLKSAKHPVFISYKQFLKSKLKVELPDNAEPIGLPKNLNGLLSIWHDRNDTKNLHKIYNNHKSIFMGKPKKKLMSCFAYTLYERKWLTEFNSKTFNPTEITKVFFELFEWTPKPKDAGLFKLTEEKPLFDIKYSRKMDIPVK